MAQLTGPHASAQIYAAGAPIGAATGAIILLHGRGGSAADILGLGPEIAPDGVTFLAPQAVSHTWYPSSFLAPIEQNEPWLSSALALVESAFQRCLAAGLPAERIAIAGFSQGACLSTEFVARNPRRYAALIAFTGGLIGPPGMDLHHPGSGQNVLGGTPVLFSSGDPDPHVPWVRVEDSARELKSMGAEVSLLQHTLRPHTILPQETEAARVILEEAFTAPAA